MPHAIWTGSISFGLVNIPVRMYAATETHQLEFHQFDRKTEKRIHYKRVAEGGNQEIPYDRIVDGYEIQKGKFITLTDEEMATAEPKKSKTLDIEDFVPLSAIDPITWNHTYFLGPDGRSGGDKAYAVLRDAMADTKRVAIGRFVMRTKQYLATLRPFGKALALETMFFEDEIRDVKEIPELGGTGSTSPRELELAKKLIQSLSGEWDHGKYKDDYRDRLLEVIRKKSKGKSIDTAPAEKEEGEVLDLMAALKQSLGKKADPAAAPPSHARRKSQTAKRRAA
jgi:DNA end-binding protein Ku